MYSFCIYIHSDKITSSRIQVSTTFFTIKIAVFTRKNALGNYRTKLRNPFLCGFIQIPVPITHNLKMLQIPQQNKHPPDLSNTFESVIINA